MHSFESNPPSLLVSDSESQPSGNTVYYLPEECGQEEHLVNCKKGKSTRVRFRSNPDSLKRRYIEVDLINKITFEREWMKQRRRSQLCHHYLVRKFGFTSHFPFPFPSSHLPAFLPSSLFPLLLPYGLRQFRSQFISRGKFIVLCFKPVLCFVLPAKSFSLLTHKIIHAGSVFNVSQKRCNDKCLPTVFHSICWN